MSVSYFFIATGHTSSSCHNSKFDFSYIYCITLTSQIDINIIPYSIAVIAIVVLFCLVI